MSQASYAGSDLDRMRQGAMARVREMQDRARQSTDTANSGLHNWSTDPNIRRRNPASYRQEEPAYIPPPPPPSPHEPEPEPEFEQRRQPPTNRRHTGTQQRSRGSSFFGRQTAPPRPDQSGASSTRQQTEKPKDTTLLQDVLGNVGLDDDRILILGLILILINDKADTTLILALLYLLL